MQNTSTASPARERQAGESGEWRFLDDLADAVVSIDPDQIIVFLNDRARKLFDYTDEELIGADLGVLLPEASRARHRGHVARFLASADTGRHMEAGVAISGRRRDGTSFPAEMSIFKTRQGGERRVMAIVRDVTARKTREDELAASEAKHRAILEASPDAVLVAETATGRITEANARAGELFACPVDALIGLHQSALHPSDQQDHYREQFRKHAHRDHFLLPDATVVRRDGSLVPVEIFAKPITIGGQHLIVGFFRDITRWKDREGALMELRRAAEAANHENQKLVARLQNAQRMAWIGSWSHDLATDAVWWSEEVYRIFGVDPSTCDLAYDDFVARIHPQDRAFVEDAITKSIAGEQTHAITFRIVRADGEVRRVREQAELIRGRDGTPLLLDGVIQDITEQQAHQAELEAAKERAETASEDNRRLAARLQKAQRIARLGSWNWNLSSGALWWSDEVYRIFGLERSAVRITYESSLDLVHEDDRGMLDDTVRAAVAERRSYSVHYRIRRPDGRVRTLREEAEMIPDQAGGAWAMDGVIQDITEDQKREAELRAAKDRADEAAAAKCRFLALMSHELRTPLNAIIGFSDLIAREAFGPLGNATYREYAGDIHASGEHLLAIINDVLEMSRVKAGKAELTAEDLPVRKAAADAVRLIGEKVERHGVTITTHVEPAELTVIADPPRVRQMLCNLVDNAIKFSGSGAEIRIVGDCSEAGCVRLHVTDPGGGIPEDLKPRITEAFTQAAETHSRNREGIGLGLALVKAYTEMHEGWLSIDSELGRGTTITVTFPAAAPGRPVRPPGRTPDG